MDLHTEEDVEIFRSDIKSFQKIDSEIEHVKTQMKPFQLKLKELRSKKKELEQEICLTMCKNNMHQAELQDTGFKVEFLQKEAVVPISQKIIKEKIVEFFERGAGSKISFNSLTGIQKSDAMINYLFNCRERVQKDVLKPIKD